VSHQARQKIAMMTNWEMSVNKICAVLENMIER